MDATLDAVIKALEEAEKSAPTQSSV
jgi:hypothetical protein